MCTEKCFELTQAAAGRAGSTVTRRAALLGGAAVAASAALGGTAQAGERAPAFPGGRHGLRDLTYPLTTSFPAFTPGEEAARQTVATIENDGYYMGVPRSATPMPTAAPTRPARCTSPVSVLTPANGCCAAEGSAASASTRSASTRGTRRRSRRT